MNQAVVMVKFGFRSIVLLGLILLLSFCFEPRTPREVTLAFWMAVLNDDVEDAVKYSTLSDEKLYDSFSRDWDGYQPTWGRIIIDGNAASIVSDFVKSFDSSQGKRKFITYLVKRNDEWKVDYERTRISVHGGVLANLFDEVNQLGDDLAKQLNSSAEVFKFEMDRMSRDLEQIGRFLDYETSKSINKFTKELQRSIQELEKSINRELKYNYKLDTRDKGILRVVLQELEQNRESLEKASVEVISRSGQSIGKTRQLLESIHSDAIAKRKNEWRGIYRKIASDMEKMLEELSFRLKRNTT